MVHQARRRGDLLFRKMSESVSVVALMSKAKERPVDRRSPAWRLVLLSAIAMGTAQLLLAQSSEYRIIDWNSFNVDNGYSAHFNNGAGATLNRVIGPDASIINGDLIATGSLFVLNSNGVVIGANGRVLIRGDFTASSRDLSNADFLTGGNCSLLGNGHGTVTNLGKISSTGG